MWADSHCHLPYPGLEDVEAHLAAAREAGVGRMVSVGTDAAQSAAAIGVAEGHDGVWATVGLHPHDAKEGVDTLLPLLGAGRSPAIVGIGECGLDFHYDHSPRDAQREVFAAQIALAHAHDLPLVIHTREAWDATFEILEAEGVPRRTVFHCFTGDAHDARRCLDVGAVLSISGLVTFKTADDIRAAVDLAPLDRLMVETDSPFLTPVPFRGKPNLPGYLPLVGAGIAAVKGVGVAEVAAATWATAEDFYGLSAA